MTVADIVEICPSCSQVLLEYGLHCIGCGASSWETLEDGAFGHGMSDEGIDAMVEELNELYELEQKGKDQKTSLMKGSDTCHVAN